MAGDKKDPSDQTTATPIPASAAERHPGLLERIKDEAESLLHRRPGLSITPGLREVPGSQAPATADGTAVAHVVGPQQAACDPVAAGLDTTVSPLTRNENRVITQTGTLGSGNVPSTYAEKGVAVAKPVSDGSEIPSPPESEAAATPGPASGAPVGDLIVEKAGG